MKTLEKIRRKVKVVEAKSQVMINEMEKRQKSASKREYALKRRNEDLQNEVKKLRRELDDSFPDTLDSSFDMSQTTECDKDKATGSVDKDQATGTVDKGQANTSVKKDHATLNVEKDQATTSVEKN